MKTTTTPKEFSTRKIDPATLPVVPGKMCQCGNPAVKKSVCGWGCARCLRIEASHFSGGGSHGAVGRGKINDV